jgi:hypothetical protein
MPCDSPLGRDDDWAGLKAELDTVTRLLCDICNNVELLHVRGCFTPAVRAWWDAHKLHDAQRRLREEAHVLRENLRREALQKLSAEEREALGVQS